MVEREESDKIKIEERIEGQINVREEGAAKTWIEWHCRIEGHEYLVEIDKEFI